MSTQLSLLQIPDSGRARKSDPDTAKRAAASVDARSVEGIVVGILRRHEVQFHEGLTTEEIAQKSGLSLVTVSPRMRPLSEKGLVADSGLRRKNESGRQAIIWKAVMA
jgi:predicted ArsR family transcriptional regulator